MLVQIESIQDVDGFLAITRVDGGVKVRDDASREEAAMMLDELRNSILTLTCIRSGLDPAHRREVDALRQHELAAVEAVRDRQRSAGLREPFELSLAT